MRKYFTNKTIKDTHYEGLKPDQARALYLIAEAGAAGLTDAQLAGRQHRVAQVGAGDGRRPLAADRRPVAVAAHGWRSCSRSRYWHQVAVR